MNICVAKASITLLHLKTEQWLLRSDRIILVDILFSFVGRTKLAPSRSISSWVGWSEFRRFVEIPFCYSWEFCPRPFTTFWVFEAIHAVTIMSLNSERYRPTIICRCWPADRFVSFHRISVGPKGVKSLKSGRAKTYSCLLASKSGGAFALPPLQLVPPLEMSDIKQLWTFVFFKWSFVNCTMTHTILFLVLCSDWRLNFSFNDL